MGKRREFELGQEVGSFVIERVVPLDELKSVLIEARHKGCGACVMYVGCEDDENLFCISFKTHPSQSDGVAHILEHTVLCGSEKFPVRDPFFSMNRRSLNTFMNALTGPDFTCYPAASTVRADFYNLLSVYIDAVFHPFLTQASFWQEGHRLEIDDKGKLSRKGIVLNEMKGAMASAESRLNELLMQLTFPDLTYGINSGGDPAVIPHLSHKELKSFHANYYHPSRALFFFYGDLPLEEHLDFIDNQILKKATRVEPIPPIPKQKRFSKPVKQVASYPISELEEETGRTFVALSWLTCSILDQQELLALIVIDLVLMGTDAAPLKMALLKSGLCKGAESVLDNELSEIPFTLVLKGCEKGSSEAIESFVREELQKIVHEGLAPHLVDGAIHQLEMARSEIGGGSHPFGLSVFLRAALLKQHGGQSEAALLIHSLFDALRKRVEDQRVLPNLIEKHLLKNPHFVHLELQPDKNLGKKEDQAEAEALKQIEKTLTNADKEALQEQQKQLEAYQEEAKGQDLDVLPKVTLKDVPKKAKDFLLDQEKIGSLEVFQHSCFTNGLIYADVVYDLPQLDKEQLQLLRLFSVFLPQIGCGGRSYKENLDTILEHTGGIDVSLDLGIQVNDPNVLRPSISVRGKALERKKERFFSLLKETVTSADFTDVPRIKELLMQHLHSLEQSVHKGSLRYAINLGLSGLSSSAQIGHWWFGLPYYWYLLKVSEAFEKDPSSLIDKLNELQSTCLCLEEPKMVLSCEKSSYKALKTEGFFGLEALPEKPFSSWQHPTDPIQVPSQGRITSSPVAFTALCYPSVPYRDEHSAALAIASEIMENKVLHPKIREQGGAYGSGAVQGLLSGHFYFYAYRDPHLKSSLSAMQEAITTVASGAFDEKDLEEAKLGMIQQLDDPIAPGGRAEAAYFRLRSGRTLAFRQAFRDRLLALNTSDVQYAVEKVLSPQQERGVVVTFAGKTFFDKENEQLSAPLPLYTVEP